MAMFAPVLAGIGTGAGATVGAGAITAGSLGTVAGAGAASLSSAALLSTSGFAASGLGLGAAASSGGFLASIGGASGALKLGLSGASALQTLGKSISSQKMLEAQAKAANTSAKEAHNQGRARALQVTQARNEALASTTAAIGAGGGTFSGTNEVSLTEADNITGFNVSMANADARRAFLSGLGESDRFSLRARNAGASGVNALVPLAQGIGGAFF